MCIILCIITAGKGTILIYKFKKGDTLVSAAKNIDGKKVKVKQTLFTWSNLISLSRVFIALPIVYLHYTNGFQVTWIIGILILYGMISDYLDGYVARKLNEISEWGKVLDPIADKISASILFLYTVYIGYVPLWFLVVELVRDAIILAGSTYLKFARGKVAMAVMSGKWSVNALAGYWMAAFILPDYQAIQNFFMGIALVLMFLSFIDYFHRFKLIREGLEYN